LILDTPAFFINAPTDNLHFKAVVLNVHARGQHKHFFRDLAIIAFPPLVKVVRFDLFALFLPRFAHFGICPRFQKFDIAFFLLFVRGQEFFDDFPPLHKEGGKGVQVKPPDLPFRVGRNKFPFPELLLPFRFAGNHAARRANAPDVVQLVFVEYDVRPQKGGVCPARRARYVPFLLCAVFVLNRNP